jgi:hypothetical protein
MFRFTIRDLLWLMVMLAMSLGMVLERLHHINVMKSAISIFNENESLKAEINRSEKFANELIGRNSELTVELRAIRRKQTFGESGYPANP